MRRSEPRQYGLSAVSALLFALTLLPVAGCGIGSERKDPLEIRAQKLELEKTELMRDLQQSRAENKQLADQIKTLSVIPQSERANLYKLDRVNIVKYSNFYDKDNDGKREKFIVYVQPVDAQGDAFKAAGTVSVQLWNLNNLNGQALLGQWQVEPKALRDMWFDTLVSANYRIVLDTPEKLDILADPLTIKVTFTDYLSGEIFRDQHVIDPNLTE